MTKLFFHPRDNKTREGKSWRPWRLLWVTAMVSFLSTPIWLIDWPVVAQLATDLRDALVEHSYFSVREIKVNGGARVGGSEIVALAGLSHGMNIWKIDPRAIEGKVQRHLWVKQVMVRREFPHRVVIEVQERVPRGVVVLGKLYYVDADGLVFKEVEEGEQVDLPFLTGLKQEELLSDNHSSRQRIQKALKVDDFLRRRSLSLSEIHFSLGERAVLYPVGYAVPVTMGWDDWQDKLERLERVMSEWRGKENRLVSLDLSFRDRVVARVRKSKMQNAN